MSTTAYNFISQILKKPRSKPLVVGIQGIQGSGKSTLVSALAKLYKSTLNVVTLSIDDFYYPKQVLDDRHVSKFHNSPLYSSRGLPGTHDIKLLNKVLSDLVYLRPTKVPVYDKLMHNGQGDRVGEEVLEPPYDLVLLEGWCLGFVPLNFEHSNNPDIELIEAGVQETNNLIYPFIDAFVELRAPSYEMAFKWRLQQEKVSAQAQKRTGMSDDEVFNFVNKFVLCYELYLDNLITKSCAHWCIISIDENRNVISTLSDLEKVECSE